jgi:hypothetical protein
VKNVLCEEIFSHSPGKSHGNNYAASPFSLHHFLPSPGGKVFVREIFSIGFHSIWDELTSSSLSESCSSFGSVSSATLN